MPNNIKKTKTLFIVLIFAFFSKSYSQTLSIPFHDSGRSIEEIVLQEIDFQNDSIRLKKFLAPLQQSSSKKYNILYYALLANGYSSYFDKINSKSDKYFLLSIQKAKDINDIPLVVWTEMNYSKYLYHYRNMDKLIPTLLKTIENAENIKPEKMILPGETFKIFGWIMTTIDDNDLSLKFLKKSLEYSKTNTPEYASILNAIGTHYLKTDKLSTAMHYFNKTIAVSLQIGDNIRYAKALGDKALIYEKRGDYKTALQLLEKDIDYSKKYKDEKNNMYALILMAKILLKNQDTSKATIFLQKAEKIALSKSYYNNSLKDIIELKLDILNGSDPEKELLLRRELKRIDDSLLKTDGENALRKANWFVQKTKYKNELKEAQKQNRQEIKTKNIYAIIVILAVLLSVSILIIFKKRLKNSSLEYDKKITRYKIEKISFENKLKAANQDLDSNIEFLHNKNIQISKLKLELEQIKKSPSYYLEEEKGKLQELLDSHLMTDENWNNFKREFKKEYGPFYETLITDYPELKDSNLKIIILQKLRFSNSEIASLLGITTDAVKKSKQRLKKKLGEKQHQLFEIIDMP
ncbi:tetratricopeptide repeat protein [Flavobacterium sp. 140616W15]|uniref:tetratricopeptide repeat protein n=1 Tax=Flavobacterium sp. 140616W15 TaxID=2478552 RepID=UPI000F0D18AD|nr:tetratricopeptide repeat protein [Flavobacterium sp. 140616W15]AYN04024.1 tetratricopeptide repeat protein [Flavobacterium sp. 140616W15]